MANPQGSDHFLRSRPLPTVGGKSSTTGHDYFLRGRPFISIQTRFSLSPRPRIQPAVNVLLRR